MSGVVKSVKKIWKKLDPIGYKFSASRALFDAMGQKGGPPTTDDQTGRQRMQRSPNAPHELVYGRCVKSGLCVLAEETGTDREYLHLVIVLAPHQVKSIGTVYFNDKPSTDYPSEYFRIKKHLGSPTQAADPDLVSEISKWTANHKLSGIAYVYVRFKYDKEGKVWNSGVPNVKCEMEGKNDIWDPRTDTYGYSENAALCMLDYAISPRGGKLDLSKIPLSKWIAAANACDEVVTTPVGTEPRYSLNGVVKTTTPVAENFDSMVSAMGGHWSMTLSGFVAVPGVYQGAPAIFLNEDDFMSDVQINPRSTRKDTFNIVRGQFIDPDAIYMPQDFPEVKDQDLITQFGEEIVEDVEFPYTISPYAAQRLARLMMARNKTPMTVSFEASTKGMLVGLGENAAVTNSVLGWNNYSMRLIDFELQPRKNDIKLTLREENAAMYDYADGNLQLYTAPPRTSLPSSFDVPAPTNLIAVNVHVTAPTGQLKVGVKCSWTKPNFAFVRDYEVQWSPAGQNQWTGYIATEPTDTLEGLVEGDVIDIRVRTVANWGSASNWLTLNSHTVTSKAIPPGGPASLSVTGGYRRLNLGWTLPADPDVKETEIYVSPTNDLNNALLLAKVAAPSTFYRHAVDPSVTNYYWIRCKDTSGNYSVWHPTNTTGIGATSSSFDYGDFSGNLPMINMPDGVNNDLLTYNQIRNPGLFGALADFNEADWQLHVANRPANLSGLSGIETIRNDSLIANDLLNGAGWALLPESGATLGATAEQARQLGRGTTVFNETFDTSDSIDDWYRYTGLGEINWSSMAGTTALRNGLGSMRLGTLSGGDDMVWAVHNQRIPFNPNLLYKITFVVFESSGSLGTMYAGVTGFDASGNPIAINGQASYSSSHYVAAVNEPVPENVLKTYTGWFKGHASSGNGGYHPDPQDPATLHEDIRTFSPVIITQYQSQSGRTYVDAIIVEAFDNTTMRNVHTTIVGQNALRDSVGIDQGDGTIRRAPFGLGAGVIRDGGSHIFSTPFNTPPIIKFRGGVTYSTTLSGKQNLVTKAVNVSPSGFDVTARIKELAGSTTLRTDTSGASNVSGYDFVKHKSQSAQAWDDNYEFQIDVTVNNFYEPEFDEYFPGNVKVGFYTNDGSGWVKRGEKTYYGNNFSATKTYLNDKVTISADGLANHGGYEFAVDVISTGIAGGQIDAFDAVRYYTATAPNDETGTPSGAEDLIFELLAGE